MAEVVTVLNPYEVALSYRNSFWLGALPLPYKEKHPPPTDWTGHRAEYPSVEQIEEWQKLGRRNIGIRLAGVDKEYEIIGIDVDHYIKGDKDKRGGDQLRELENQLGPLPDTWISSARVDGKSGIRYFRLPRGLAFRGQVDKDIECINKGYRFAVVWPSIHPDGGTYWWFPPGTVPDKSGKDVWDGTIPNARQLPILPDKWITYLTQGKMRSEALDLIDMDSTVDEIWEWADGTFYGDDDTVPCDKLREKLDKHKKLIEDEATSHDKLINGHYNIIRLAAEGHHGWVAAINELDNHFVEVTVNRGKRGFTEVNEEIFRSRVNAIRKVKAQIEARVAIGASAVDPSCLKTGACGGEAVHTATGPSGTDPLDHLDFGQKHPVDWYEMNDDGNALHMAHFFSNSDMGPEFRYAEGIGWLIWVQKGIENPHWEVDEDGKGLMRLLWQRVKKHQLDYIENALRPDYENEVNNWGFNGPQPITLKAAKAKLDKWKAFVEKNGNNRNADNAILAAQSVPGVTISPNVLDSNSFLLGVANGVVELDNENVRLRKAVPQDLVTLNTRTDWERPSDLASSNWQDYLDTFLPDHDLQRATQVALGHCIIGGNPEKIMIVLKGAPNTGKSTMVTALQTALGDYAEPVNQSIFQNHKLNPILADAISKRVIVCSEFDEDDKLSASQVKRMTGGHDEIRAEKKGSNAKFSGIPQFVPILATNEVPQIAGADKALQNRLYVIPFNISPTHVRKEFANIIKATCGTAILDWLIEGYKLYRQMGQLPAHQAVRNATSEFVAELDEIATFAAECIVSQTKPSGYIKSRDMYARFERWWIENSFQQREKPSHIKFTRRLKALGYECRQIRVNDETGKFWLNVKFAPSVSKIVSMANVFPVSGANSKQET